MALGLCPMALSVTCTFVFWLCAYSLAVNVRYFSTTLVSGNALTDGARRSLLLRVTLIDLPPHPPPPPVDRRVYEMQRGTEQACAHIDSMFKLARLKIPSAQREEIWGTSKQVGYSLDGSLMAFSPDILVYSDLLGSDIFRYALYSYSVRNRHTQAVRVLATLRIAVFSQSMNSAITSKRLHQGDEK